MSRRLRNVMAQKSETVVVNSQSQAQTEAELAEVAEVAGWHSSCESKSGVKFDEVKIDFLDGVSRRVGVRTDSFLDPNRRLRAALLCAACVRSPGFPVRVPVLWSLRGRCRVLGRRS